MISPEKMLADKLRERSGFMREAGHDDDADLDIQAACLLDDLATLRAERDEAREALKALDDYWTEDFPDGPEGSRVFMNGLGTVAEETMEIWRKVRAAHSTLSPEDSHG